MAGVVRVDSVLRGSGRRVAACRRAVAAPRLRPDERALHRRQVVLHGQDGRIYVGYFVYFPVSPALGKPLPLFQQVCTVVEHAVLVVEDALLGTDGFPVDDKRVVPLLSALPRDCGRVLYKAVLL